VAGFISVVVATRNRQALLAETLDALAAQQWPGDRGEIIVADNGSTDATRATIRLAAARGQGLPVHYLYVGEPGKSAAINMALQHAQGDLIAFTDDDAVPEPAWLAQLAAAFEDPSVDFVAGRILPRWEAPPPAWMSPSLYGVLAIGDGGELPLRIEAGGRAHPMTVGANMAVRMSVIRRLGGLRRDLGKLDGTLRTGEDHEFFLRMIHGGCLGVYVPSAIVRHFVPRARLRREYFRAWLYQNGQDVARLETAYPAGRRLFGVPRYLWRTAAADAAAAIKATIVTNPAARFAALVRLIWLGGYLRAAWFGGAHLSVRPAIPAAEEQ